MWSAAWRAHNNDAGLARPCCLAGHLHVRAPPDTLMFGQSVCILPRYTTYQGMMLLNYLSTVAGRTEGDDSPRSGLAIPPYLDRW